MKILKIGLLTLLTLSIFLIIFKVDPRNVVVVKMQSSGGTVFLPFLSRAKIFTFIETFDGDPVRPTPWTPAIWDVTVHSRNISTWDQLEPMQAAHGIDCSPSPATHPITKYEDSVFICRNHMMTALNSSSYGVIYLTPNHMVDFSTGEAVIQFDLSTSRTSLRDWVDIWITPYDNNLQLPLADFYPDLSGEPKKAIQIEMGLFNGKTNFRINQIENFIARPINSKTQLGYETFLLPSAMRRDTFELRISRNHIKFGMPAYNFWWYDQNIPTLDWSLGVVQFGHHSYTPAKDCSNCGPNTWHWDNIHIIPAIPFTIIRATQRYTDQQAGAKINLSAPAPFAANLRFSGIGKKLQVSFNNGLSWVNAVPQAQEKYVEEAFWSYWMPIPEGTQTILFTGQNWWGGSWRIQDVSVWSEGTN